MRARETPVPVLDHGAITLIEVWGGDARLLEAARATSSVRHVSDEKLWRFAWEHHRAEPLCELVGLTVDVQAPAMVAREWPRHVLPWQDLPPPTPALYYVPDRDRLTGAEAWQNKTNERYAWLDTLAPLYAHVEQVLAAAGEVGVHKDVLGVLTLGSQYVRGRVSATLRQWLALTTRHAHGPTRPDGLPEDDRLWELRQYAYSMTALIVRAFPRTLGTPEEMTT